MSIKEGGRTHAGRYLDFASAMDEVKFVIYMNTFFKIGV